MESSVIRTELIFNIASKNIKNVLSLGKNNYEQTFKVKSSRESSFAPRVCFSHIRSLDFPIKYFPQKSSTIVCGSSKIDNIELLIKIIKKLFTGIDTNIFKDFGNSIEYSESDESITVKSNGGESKNKSKSCVNILTIIRGTDEYPMVYEILWALFGEELFSFNREELIACLIACESLVHQNDNHKVFSCSGFQHNKILNIGNKKFSSANANKFLGEERNFVPIKNQEGFPIALYRFQNSNLLEKDTDKILELFRTRFLAVIK